MKIPNRQTRLYLISAIILVVGLSSAILIYQSAMDDPDYVSEYEIVNGAVYPGSGYSKRYVHDLQLYGGQTLVLADEITRWFTGLWHGKSLAYTISLITLFMSLGFFIAARMTSLRLTSGGHNQKKPG